MLRTFIFDDSKLHWVEENHHLFSQDICALLDDEEEIVYLWRGIKASKKRFKKGYNQIKELISSFPELDLNFMMAEKNFPTQVKEKIDTMLESTKEERIGNLLFSRFITIRIFFISLSCVVILPIIYTLSLSSSLLWTTNGENYEVSSNIFQLWIANSKIFTIIIIICLSLNLLIGVIESENQVIVFSIVGLMICVGLFIYINFDIYLFLFQAGSTSTRYLILRRDIWYFIIIIISSLLVFEIPNFAKLIVFLKKYKKFIF
ncbi:MAG: hypothetical protein ACFFA3_11025 [Promethearchaeota archaeon]